MISNKLRALALGSRALAAVVAAAPASAQSALPVGGSVSSGAATIATAASTVYPGWNFAGTWLSPNQAGQNGAATPHYPRLAVRPTP